MSRRSIVDEDMRHERWLVSYADFLTLLLAFFVVMYSISQVNESKYRVLSNTLTEAFNLPEYSDEPLQLGQLAKSNPLNVIEMEASNVDDKQGEGIDNASEEGKIQQQFQQLSQDMEELFSDLIDKNLIAISGNEEWLVVELSAGLLFESGQAELAGESEVILNEIAQLLFDHDRPVRVEGFTDNIPISTAMYPSNWELSTARAAAVVQLFVESGLDPAKMAAVGYGEHQPKADNTTTEGRSQNRRVVLMISKTGKLRPSVDLSQGQEVAVDFQQEENNIPNTTEAENKFAEKLPAVEITEGERKINGIKTLQLKSGGLLFTSDEKQVKKGESKASP